ncbi:hypothetical protein G6F43_013685 [Rhizopus delemar]|nr:hypothetical protein G6F43_013685 [Rhizopus delemar]
MLSLLEDKLRNKKKNKEETTFQWKSLPSWTALQSNSKKKISSVSEGTQNDMNRENGQLLRESIVSYTEKSASINPTPLMLSRRYTRSLKPLVFKPKWQQRYLNNSNMSSNRPPVWTKLERLSTEQQSKANAWQSLDSLKPRTKNEFKKLRNRRTQYLQQVPDIWYPKKKITNPLMPLVMNFLQTLSQARFEQELLQRQSANNNRSRGCGNNYGDNGKSRGYRGRGRGSFFGGRGSSGGPSTSHNSTNNSNNQNNNNTQSQQ